MDSLTNPKLATSKPRNNLLTVIGSVVKCRKTNTPDF
jgi:hypothetical protein